MSCNFGQEFVWYIGYLLLMNLGQLVMFLFLCLLDIYIYLVPGFTFQF